MTVERVPIAPDLFTWPADEPQLIGGKCTTCGVVTFPKQGSCPRCNGQEIEPELLARQGTLWTWTIQGFLPKSPPYAGPETAKDFQGYGVGYVELPGQVKVETRLTENDPAKLEIGMPVELVIIPFTQDADGREVVTYAFGLQESTLMDDVAIVGIGIHPFGRHDSTGMEQGAFAVRQSLKDAGIEWNDVQFAFGGSAAAGGADTMVSQLGLTGLPFVNVANGCATGGSALISAYNTIRSGAADVVMAIGFDKHPRGAFDPDPAAFGLGKWYGDTGLMLTTQFFGMKIQRYMHEYGITANTLAKVAAKAFRNGALNENAWRRKPFTEEEIEQAPMLSNPLTQYMFCSPGEGGIALVLCRADKVADFPTPPVFLRSAVLRSRPFGSFEVFSPWLPVERGNSPSVAAAKGAFEMAGVEPGEIDVIQVQDTESGAEVMHLAECGFVVDGEQEDLIQRGETEIGGRMPVNTDGGCLANGEPIGASGLRQVYECVLQLRGGAGDRQVPNDPQTAFTHVYGAPGISACTVLSR